MGRSRHSGWSFVFSPTFIAGVCGAIGILIVFLIAPWLRDTVGLLVSDSARNAEYATIPRSVLVERLRNAESELERTRYQSVLYAELSKKLQNSKTSTSTREYKTARVIAYPPKSHYDTLVIDAGSADDVRTGDHVYIEKMFIGSVSGISTHTATIQLNSSPGSVRDARVGKPASIISIQGVGGGAFEASVPADVETHIGESVIDVSTGKDMGFVVERESKQSDTSATLRIALPISFSSITTVQLEHVEP